VFGYFVLLVVFYQWLNDENFDIGEMLCNQWFSSICSVPSVENISVFSHCLVRSFNPTVYAAVVCDNRNVQFLFL